MEGFIMNKQPKTQKIDNIIIDNIYWSHEETNKTNGVKIILTALEHKGTVCTKI